LPETGWNPFDVKSGGPEGDESLSSKLRVDRMSTSTYEEDGLSMSISALSVAQIRAVSTAAAIGAFSSMQLGGFADTQIQALTTALLALDSTRYGALSATIFA
jgi:hypothetical protein